MPSRVGIGRSTASNRPRPKAGQPFKLDSHTPSIPVREFVATETRFAILERTHPERAAHLAALAQADADERWRYYTQLAGVQRTVPHVPDRDVQPDVEYDAGYQLRRGVLRWSISRPAISVSSCARRSSPLPRRSPGTLRRSASSRTPVSARSCCRPCSRKRSSTRRSSSTGPWRPARTTSPRPSTTSPRSPTFADAGQRYLGDLEGIKARSAIPVIGSLNATSTGGWTRYARLIEEAGADAVELNLYHVAADPHRTAADIEAADLEVVAATRAQISIPLAVKLSPYYSAMANFATRVVAAGADGLVLFNRFYQPDLDLATLEVVPRVELSHQWELRLPMRWIAILRPMLPDVGLAATSGITEATDVVKALMVGADVAMTTSAVLRHGPEYIRALEAELRAWMEEHGYDSVAQLRGSASHATSANPSAFERANYMRTLHSWTAPLSAAGE